MNAPVARVSVIDVSGKACAIGDCCARGRRASRRKAAAGSIGALIPGLSSIKAWGAVPRVRDYCALRRDRRARRCRTAEAA